MLAITNIDFTPHLRKEVNDERKVRKGYARVKTSV